MHATTIWATSWESLFIPYTNNKDADQLAHLHSLISVKYSLISSLVVHCLDSACSHCIRNSETTASFRCEEGWFELHLSHISEVWLTQLFWGLGWLGLSGQGSYLSKAAFTKNCEKVEIRGPNNVLFAHVLTKVYLRWLIVYNCFLQRKFTRLK